MSGLLIVHCTRVLTDVTIALALFEHAFTFDLEIKNLLEAKTYSSDGAVLSEQILDSAGGHHQGTDIWAHTNKRMC